MPPRESVVERGKDSREDEKIKVVDRRMFSADGSRREPDVDRDEPEEARPTPAGSDAPPREAPPASPVSGRFERRPVEEPEGVDFTLLINAMAQPVVIVLDEVPHPDPRENHARLEQARLQIDLLDLLRVKCRGNLTPDEERLLEQVLYQLRMLFVAKSNDAG